jgi:TfuA protein
VNVRFCLDRLTTRCGISAEEADHAMASLKQLNLGKRDRRSMILHLASLLGRERVKEMLRLVRPAEVDVKRSDAYELLRMLAKGSNN